MNLALPPLLCRSPLQPGESLISFLIRLAAWNRYEPATMLDRLCLAGSSDTKVAHPFQATTFQRLADLTLIQPAQLYRATIHRFAQILTPPDVELPVVTLPSEQTVPLLHRKGLNKRLRPEAGAQFCPYCLREADYHRLIWMPIAVTICLKHQALLLNACPICDHSLSIREIVHCQCQYCHADLRQASTIQISDDPFGLLAQQVIQTWFMVGVTPEETSSILPDQPAGTLYHLLEGLRMSILTFEPDWPYFHRTSFASHTFTDRRTPFNRATPAQSHLLHTTAFKAITHWPDGFYDLLHAYRCRPDKPFQHGLPADFSYLYTRCLEKRWQYPAFQFVQDAFNHYLLDHYDRTNAIVCTNRYQAITNRSPYMSVFEAAELLQTSFHFVLQLIGGGELTGYPPQDPHYLHHPFVDRAEIAAWYRQHLLISIPETAQQLALSPQVIVDLVKLRLLQAEDNPQVGQLYLGYIRKRSLDAFLHELSSRLFIPCRHMIDLTTAAKVVAGLGFNEAHLLNFVIHRQLRGYAPIHTPLDLKKLCFFEHEIRDLIAKLTTQNN